MMSAQALMSSTQKSRSDTPSRLFSQMAAEAELLRLKDAVGRVRRPGQGTAADGGGVHAPAGVGKAAIVALQHHGVGQQLLAEGDGLRALQMGVARHDGILVGARLRVQGRDDGQHERLQRGDLVFQIQPQVKRDLIVA